MKTIATQAMLWTCGLALALGAASDARAAATANFQGNCSWNAAHTQYTCNFAANRPTASPSSCPGSFIWKYQWDFDDGSTLLTGNPLVTHTFVDGPERVVTLHDRAMSATGSARPAASRSMADGIEPCSPCLGHSAGAWFKSGARLIRRLAGPL